MENENGTLDWQEFVNSHNERCKAYEEDSTFSVEEAKELLTLIRNGQASNEQIIKFRKKERETALKYDINANKDKILEVFKKEELWKQE